MLINKQTFYLSRGESVLVRIPRIRHLGMLRTILTFRQKCALAISNEPRPAERLASNRPVLKGLITIIRTSIFACN